MTFVLDGNVVGMFEQVPNGDTSYQYNHIVFSNSDLEPGQHTLIIVSGVKDAKALVLLDKIVYT